jgi:hypothetical protein
MREHASIEALVRRFAQEEVRRYNKKAAALIRIEETRPATREFWDSGKRVRNFIKTTLGVVQDRVWYSLEQWGRGEGGYGKNWLEYACYFFDWKPDAGPADPVFTLSETRVMNILRATKASDERDRLLVACLGGSLGEFTDEEFKWVTGQSESTFPLTPELFEEFESFGRRVMKGLSFERADLARMDAIRILLEQTPPTVSSSQLEQTSDE